MTLDKLIDMARLELQEWYSHDELVTIERDCFAEGYNTLEWYNYLRDEVMVCYHKRPSKIPIIDTVFKDFKLYQLELDEYQ